MKINHATWFGPALLLLSSISIQAQDTPATEPKPRLDIYGFAMLDTGYQVKQNDPDWFDVVRPTKLPAYKDEFGGDGHWFASVRQTRFGTRGYIPTKYGELKTIFEFELFGTGVDAGQTTFRLRHAWGEVGKFGGGQTWSPFMDIDVFPNSIEYWGPNGMVFFRNVQFRYTPWSKGDSNFMLAIERPGASADQGPYANRIELEGIKARFPMPDFSSHYRWAGSRGHLQVGAILRRIYWDDTNNDQFDLSGSATGWGINVSANVKVKKHVLRLQSVYGEGIQNYMNDAPADVGIKNTFSNPNRPIEGKPLPIVGLVGFFDLNWSERWTSTIGYSRVDIRTLDGQEDTAFKSGQYALTNLLFHPTKEFFVGSEFQWGYRDNRANWHTHDYRVQFSAKYNFSFSVEGK